MGATASPEEVAEFAEREGHEGELELDILDRLAMMATDIQAKAIRSEPGMYSRERSTVLDAITEIQRLRKDLEKIHNFSHASRVGSRRRPIVGSV